MKPNQPNPFHIDKYFDDVKGKRINAQEAINLTSVLAQNKVDMYRMIKNAGVTNVKDLYQKCQKNFERITKEQPKANILAAYAMKRPKQEIQHSKGQATTESRKQYLRKAESTGKIAENRNSVQRTNQRDYYEKLLNLSEGDNSKLVDDVIQMMLVMAEYIQDSQQIEEEQKQQQNQHHKSPQFHHNSPNQQQYQQLQQLSLTSSSSQPRKKSSSFSKSENPAAQLPVSEPLYKKKPSIPQIRIIVASPPKEVQSQPDLIREDEFLDLSSPPTIVAAPAGAAAKQQDILKSNENLEEEKLVEYSEVIPSWYDSPATTCLECNNLSNITSCNSPCYHNSQSTHVTCINEDDDSIPDDIPLSIISSTLFRFSLQLPHPIFSFLQLIARPMNMRTIENSRVDAIMRNQNSNISILSHTSFLLYLSIQQRSKFDVSRISRHFHRHAVLL